VNRGAIFGGKGNPITLRTIGGLLIGLHRDGFENQVASVLLRVRPPLGRFPLELYYEGGMDDTAGSFRDVPAAIAGFDVGALPGLSALGVGLEHARYAPYCCGNTIWYRNLFLRGSWANEGRLFAHPLGGHGREWLGHVRVDLPGSALLMRAEVFARRRGAENLYAPERQGRSRGASITLEYAPRSGTDVRVDAAIEDARQWTLQRFSAMISHALGARPR
jgi:hypothetical protein